MRNKIQHIALSVFFLSGCAFTDTDSHGRVITHHIGYAKSITLSPSERDENITAEKISNIGIGLHIVGSRNNYLIHGAGVYLGKNSLSRIIIDPKCSLVLVINTKADPNLIDSVDEMGNVCKVNNYTGD